jgi:hypothetical protein
VAPYTLLVAAPTLPHPALEAEARAHAAFLAELAGRRDLLRREVLVVLREPPGTDAAARLHRRAAAAVPALGAAGVALAVLDGPAAASCLARALGSAGGAPLATCDKDEPVARARDAKGAVR